MRKWILVIILVLLAVGFLRYTRVLNWPYTVSQDSQVDLDRLEADKLLEAQNEAANRNIEFALWLEKLGGKEGCDGQGTWDVHSYSYGEYCFKEGTWDDMIVRYDLFPNTLPHERFNLLNGDSKIDQETVIRAMIKDSTQLARHWSPVLNGELEYPPEL